MTFLSVIKRVPMYESMPSSEKVSMCAIYVLFTYLAYLGLLLAIGTQGQVPDYDGVVYVYKALLLQKQLFLTAYLPHEFLGLLSALPFTQTLDVVLLSLLSPLVDYHIAIWLINSAYLLVFVYFLRRIFSPQVTLLLLSSAVANIYFIHLYSNFISEMKVGMFFLLFVAYIFHEDILKHLKSLFWIVVLLLLLRTVNVIIVFGVLTLYLTVHWQVKEQRAVAFKVIKTCMLAFVFLAPILFFTLGDQIHYKLTNTFSDTAKNWKDLSGITDKLSLVYFYIKSLFNYNALLTWLMLSISVVGCLLHFTKLKPKLIQFRNCFLAGCLVTAVMFTANSSHIYLVYWVYMMFVLSSAMLLRALLANYQIMFIALLAMIMAISYNLTGYHLEKKNVGNKQAVFDLAQELYPTLRDVRAHRLIWTNFGGIPALDPIGISISLNEKISRVMTNHSVISYNTTIDTYIHAIEKCDIVLLANKNFLWPKYLGMNKKTEEVYDYVSENASTLGLYKIKRLYYSSDSDRYIDIYVRLSADVAYEYQDKWMNQETTVRIQHQGIADISLDSYVLKLDVMVPKVDDPDFKLPLHTQLVSSDGRIVGEYEIMKAGDVSLLFRLDGFSSGPFKLKLNKYFSTPQDARKLSVRYRGVSVFYNKEGKNVDK